MNIEIIINAAKTPVLIDFSQLVELSDHVTFKRETLNDKPVFIVLINEVENLFISEILDVLSDVLNKDVSKLLQYRNDGLQVII